MENSKQSAFAASEENHTLGTIRLTKREYFAGLAMQGLLSIYNKNALNPIELKYMSELAVKAADALLAEL